MIALNWQAMTARERDSLVAEKVCGWEFFDDARTNPHCAASVPHNWFNPSEGSCYPIPKEFTTCPKAAMEVIEAMRAKGWAVTVAGGLGGKWVGEFWRPVTVEIIEAGLESHAVRVDTMPEAVCRAALLAVGVEIV